MGFPDGSGGKESTCNTGDPGLIPGPGRSPGEANGNPLQYPCLENPVNGGTWQATVLRVADTTTSSFHVVTIERESKKKFFFRVMRI